MSFVEHAISFEVAGAGGLDDEPLCFTRPVNPAKLQPGAHAGVAPVLSSHDGVLGRRASMQFHLRVSEEESSREGLSVGSATTRPGLAELAMLASVAAAVLLGVAYLGWRMTTPTECAWVNAHAMSWLDVGVRPTASAECPLQTGSTVVDADVSATTATFRGASGNFSSSRAIRRDRCSLSA